MKHMDSVQTSQIMRQPSCNQSTVRGRGVQMTSLFHGDKEKQRNKALTLICQQCTIPTDQRLAVTESAVCSGPLVYESAYSMLGEEITLLNSVGKVKNEQRQKLQNTIFTQISEYWGLQRSPGYESIHRF